MHCGAPDKIPEQKKHISGKTSENPNQVCSLANGLVPMLLS